MRDLRYEQSLNKSGVPWHYEEIVPLSRVDEVESFKNQARLQAIDHDRNEVRNRNVGWRSFSRLMR